MLKGLIILVIGGVLGAAGMLAWTRWQSPSSPGGRDFASGISAPAGPAMDAASARDPAASAIPSGDPGAPPPLRRSVFALGTIEPADGIVQIGSPLVGFRIEQIVVQEGQVVKQGEIVAELDGSAAQTELRLAQARESEAVERQQAEIAMARERVANAELAREQASSSRRWETEAARKRLAVAVLKAGQARQDVEHLGRLRQLVEPLASQQQVQHAQVALEAALAEQEAAAAAQQQQEQSLAFREQTAGSELRAARQSLELAEKGAGIESLREGVRLAELKVEHTRIASPTAGTVLQVLARPGELVAQQPLVQVADLDELICVAEVEAADVPHLTAGQRVIIRSRALPGAQWTGRLDRIGTSVGAAALRPFDPRQPVDRTVAKAVVRVESNRGAAASQPASHDRRAAYVGLQVEVEFPFQPAP